jgi:diphthamide biosynthesis protein 7
MDTELPADSVEFCPHPDASNIFVCGTYKLEDQQSDQGVSQPPTTQTRKGQCLVYEVHSENSEDISVYAARIANRAVIEEDLARRFRRYPSLLSWILSGEILSLFPGCMEGWSSSQVLH